MSRRGTNFLPPDHFDRVELELVCRGCQGVGRREVLDIWIVERVGVGRHEHVAHTSGPPRCVEQLHEGRWRYVYRCDKHRPALNIPYRDETIEAALAFMVEHGMSKQVVPI